jgi:hypothetical protein
MTEELYDRFQLSGYSSIYDLLESSPDELSEIRGVTPEYAAQLVFAAERLVRESEGKESSEGAASQNGEAAKTEDEDTDR